MINKSRKVIQIIGAIVTAIGFITFALSGMTFNFAFVPVGFILFVIGGFILMIGSSMNTKQTVIKNSTDVKESFERSSLENNKQTIRVKCDYCGTNYEGETCPNCGAKKK